MFELTELQRRELNDTAPAVAIDPQTQEAYILIRRSTYERMKTLLAMDEFDPDEAAASINNLMEEDDAKDPYLASYQQFGKNS